MIPDSIISGVFYVVARKTKVRSSYSLFNCSDRQDTDTSPRGESEDKWEGLQGACRVQPAPQFRRVLPHPPSAIHSLQRSRVQRGHGDYRNNSKKQCVDVRLRRNHEEGHRGDSSPTSSTQAGLEKLMPLHTLHGVFHSTLRTATASYI